MQVYIENKHAKINLKDVKGEFIIRVFDAKGTEIYTSTATGGEQKTIPVYSNPVVIIKIFNNDKYKSFKLLN